jgi:hypothetical protein
MNWEYKIVFIDATKWTSTGLPTDLGQRFDEWGAEGWELIRVEPILRGGRFVFGLGTATRTESLIAFFKRPRDRKS